jgi:hypothetical protein
VGFAWLDTGTRQPAGNLTGTCKPSKASPGHGLPAWKKSLSARLRIDRQQLLVQAKAFSKTGYGTCSNG